MKKLILVVLATAGIMTANAQRGSWLLYGNVGLHNMSDMFKTKSLDWNVNPGIGYQFNDNWTVGLDLGWTQDSTSKMDGSSDKYTRNTYNAGVFARYTKYVNGTFFVFGHLNADYQGGYDTYGSAPSFAKHSGFMVKLTPAVGMNIGKGWALTFSVGSLGYSSDKYDGVSNAATKFDFTFGQQMNFGIQKVFTHHMHGHYVPNAEYRHMDTKDDDDDSGDN